MRRTADRGCHRRSGALAARRLAEPAQRATGPTAPITMLRLHPVEVVSAAALQLPLWGSSGDDDRLRARRALVRVQGLLGPESVQVPVLSGGRGPAERITFTPLGDEPVPRADPGQPWPGQLPEPSPTVLLDDPVELLDAEGNPVRVTGRGLFSADPVRLAGRRQAGRLSWWAGPWPVDERWWDPRGGRARRGGRRGCRCCSTVPGDRGDVAAGRCCCATGSGGGTWRGSTNDASGRAFSPGAARTGRPAR